LPSQTSLNSRHVLKNVLKTYTNKHSMSLIEESGDDCFFCKLGKIVVYLKPFIHCREKQ
jgi:hypothetical protein